MGFKSAHDKVGCQEGIKRMIHSEARIRTKSFVVLKRPGLSVTATAWTPLVSGVPRICWAPESLVQVWRLVDVIDQVTSLR
jgi:hypothetical protein